MVSCVWCLAGQLCVQLRRLFVFGAWADRGQLLCCTGGAGVEPALAAEALDCEALLAPVGRRQASGMLLGSPVFRRAPS